MGFCLFLHIILSTFSYHLNLRRNNSVSEDDDDDDDDESDSDDDSPKRSKRNTRYFRTDSINKK